MQEAAVSVAVPEPVAIPELAATVALPKG